MLHQRSRRADGVRWSHSHPCLHEAAVQPGLFLLAHALQKLLCGFCADVSRTALTPHARRLRSGDSLKMRSQRSHNPASQPRTL